MNDDFEEEDVSPVYQVSPELALLVARGNDLLARLDAWLPPLPPRVDWRETLACRWRKQMGRGLLLPVTTLNCPPWEALTGIAEQKAEVERNTRQFLKLLPANNVLLAGSRGCGKSSLIKALLPRHAKQGLRLVEVDREDLIDLPDITARLEGQPWRFILFSDDLSFEPNDAAYKPLKAALDGSVAGLPDNVLIYATSNRRHLMPEFFAENEATRHLGGEVRPAESIEEKISLSDRFGLTLTFWPFNQDDYLAIVGAWVAALGGKATESMRQEAINWAIARGGRSGRVARQFAADWVGGQGLKRGRGR
ncbi:MAG: ATP-binding protein [Pseudomonadota bacterium]|nr:ATP-binding protein [Pseudomonadota bacterium]MDP1904025.1 ATP-binding protein [Pseudomonadota bacterium]MDP2352097.1 ATP-binding protein [Pseudomonadota bacterium]